MFVRSYNVLQIRQSKTPAFTMRKTRFSLVFPKNRYIYLPMKRNLLP